MTGAEIKEAREAGGWSIDRLASASGVSAVVLAEIENGANAGKHFNKIMKALGVFVDEDEPSPTKPAKLLPGDVTIIDAMADEAPGDDDVVIFDQPQTSVYRNGKGGLVIFQKGTRPFDRDEDQFVYFSTDDAVRRLIQALKREIGDA